MSDDTREPDPEPSPSARTCAMRDMDDTETAALIGDSHAFGKKHAACPQKRIILQQISP